MIGSKWWRFFDLLWGVFPLLLAVALYGYAITLPFFLDDGPHFQILAQTNGLQHWGDFPAFPFYRPLTFTVWKLVEVLGGGYSAPFLHWLNVACFGVAGVLLGQVVRHLTGGRWAAVLAGGFFVLFPFSVQAVAMVAALFHLTLALGVLLCLWAGLRWLHNGHVGWLMLACAGAFIGVFSHESGVVLPLLLGGLLLVRREWSRQAWTLLLLVTAITALYVVLWWSFRPQTETALTQDFLAGFGVLFQGLAYPVLALLRPFVVGDMAAGLLVALVILIVVGVWLWGRRPLAAYGLVWYVLAALPAALALPAGYVLGQPRLALLAAIGGGIFWGVALTSLPRGSAVLALVFVALMTYVSAEFLLMRRDDFHQLRDYNRELVHILAAHDNTAAVLVNAPDYLTPEEDDRRFLLGTEGVLFVDETLDYSQQVWMNSDLDAPDLMTIAYPAIQRNSGFGFRAHPPVVNDPAAVAEVVDDAPLVIVTQFDDETFAPVLVGGTAIDATVLPPLVEYSGFLLTGAQVLYNENVVETRLRWRVADPMPVKTFVHVYCDDAFIAQSDGYPWGDTYPFVFWQAGETQTDIRRIPLETQVTPDCLQVFTGLYHEDDLTRLPAFDAGTGERLENDQYRVENVVWKP